MLKTERQAKIVSQIVQHKTVDVTSLSERYKVSELTIRRDLDELARNGKIQRIHGGGALIESNELEPPILLRKFEQAKEKEAIARQAFVYITNGDTIGLESGSTTLALAKQIASRQWDYLHIVTNSVPILNLLIPVQGILLLFVGGLINSSELCSNITPSDEMLSHLHIDTFFCGCRSLHPRFGRTNEIINGTESATVRAFKNASDRVIVLADHTKFSKVYPVQLLQMDEINVVITSDQAPSKMLLDMSKQGVVVDSVSLPQD